MFIRTAILNRFRLGAAFFIRCRRAARGKVNHTRGYKVLPASVVLLLMLQGAKNLLAFSDDHWMLDITVCVQASEDISSLE